MNTEFEDISLSMMIPKRTQVGMEKGMKMKIHQRVLQTQGRREIGEGRGRRDERKPGKKDRYVPQLHKTLSKTT